MGHHVIHSADKAITLGSEVPHHLNDGLGIVFSKIVRLTHVQEQKVLAILPLSILEESVRNVQDPLSVHEASPWPVASEVVERPWPS